MISTIAFLTSISIGAIYPLCFWIYFDNPLKNNFHRFHLGLPTVIVGTTIFFIFQLHIPCLFKTVAIVWGILLLGITFFYWNKTFPHPMIVTLPSLVGIYLFVQVQSYFIVSSPVLMLVGILGASILCCSLFAMNLGHWYLNVRGLPMRHLKRAVTVLHVFLLIRLCWDAYSFLFGTMLYQGDLIPLTKFVRNLDGFLLLLGLFFGTILPLISLSLAHEILRLKNTQATTGVLYVILCSILLGDMVYKYYAVTFGVFM